jgi:hypothetical protein
VLLDHRQQQYKYHQQDANISTSTTEVRHKYNEIYYIDITLRLRNSIAVDGVGRWIDRKILVRESAVITRLPTTKRATSTKAYTRTEDGQHGSNRKKATLSFHMMPL